jgi:hypothetical protein
MRPLVAVLETMLLACIFSCASPKRPALSVKELFALIDSRQGDADMVASAIQASLLSINQGPGGITEIVFSVGQLMAKFPGSKLDKGILYLSYHSHRYAVYFKSINPKPICWSMDRNHGEINVKVPSPSRYDASLLVDAGLYELSMVEDQIIRWHWYLDWAHTDKGTFSGVGGEQYGPLVESVLKEHTTPSRCE